MGCQHQETPANQRVITVEGSEQTAQSTRRPVVALTADLMFAARVQGAAKAVGVDVHLGRSAADIMRLAGLLSPRLLIVDLDARSLDPIALIAQLKADAATAAIPILAYVSHVREDLITKAQRAGVDQVMARGAFARQLPSILSAD
jgi:PleD family two-component response regulator